MLKSYLISVIVPCFNQGEFLRDSLRSVLKQSYSNWECIIINDGSTDSTEQVSKEFIKLDKRFKYFYQPNGGLSAARNRGIEIAKGEYLQFLDADDMIMENKFEKELNSNLILKRKALSICNFNYWIIKNEENKDITGNFPFFKSNNFLFEIIIDWENRISFPPHCLLIESSYFKENQLRFETILHNHEDWDCWVSIFKMIPEVVFIDEKLAIYRIHDSNMTKDRKNMKKGFLKAIKLNFQKFEKSSEEYFLLKKKFNLVKYGIKSEHTFICMLGFPFLILYKFNRRVFLFLKRKLKSLT